MIKKLRRRFIAIAMLSVFLVLVTIMGVINYTNYRHLDEASDRLLTVLAENDGAFPSTLTQEGQPQHPDETTEHQLLQEDPGRQPLENMPPKDQRQPTSTDVFPGTQQEQPLDSKKEPKALPDNFSAETPFSTRFFTVTMDASGNVSHYNTSQIAAISAATAQEMAITLHANGDTDGYYETYKYLSVTKNQETLYIFIDCSESFDTFYSFLWTSCWVSLTGLALVFILVWIFSRIVMAPVAESYEKQKQFITDASHELKTPLTIIDANTEVLEMEQGENEWTGSIRNQVKRLSEFTQKLVFLSRMEEESTVLPMTDFSLSDAVLETAEPFRAVATAGQKSLTLDVQPDVSLHGDETTIRQLVSLLLDNAVKYSPANGTIHLQLQTSGKRKQLTVENTVTERSGQSPQLWFQRFYRPDQSRNSKTGGHGIGLSVASAIVSAHKGKISAAYKDDHTVVFTVIL